MPFEEHITLLRQFLAQRERIVERIQGVLNAQHRPAHQLRDRGLLSRQFEDCFFTADTLGREQLGLRGQLQQAHWASGFRPRDMPGIPNEMFDPADMMSRAFMLWQHTRWPGRNGRLRYAQTLFNLYVVRCLTLLDMRLWDAGADAATQRLALNQAVLDELWRGSPPDQPVLVRDVRWLVPVAQSPTTDDLGPYFGVAQQVAECLREADSLEIHKASVLMAGGHLRSQLRHFTMQGRALGDASLVLDTRRSNALDSAMTIQGLVPLLAAYARAVQSGDGHQRTVLAGVICQAVSPDPELFIQRLDLLSAYSMIEHLFIAADADGRVTLTPMGERHLRLLGEYRASLSSLGTALHEDCRQFRPEPGIYSPYGVMYGFSSNLLEHMTLKALQPEAERRFSLEDVFTDGGHGAERLAWVSGWRRLPHVSAEVQKLYEYPQEFAAGIFGRVETVLEQCVAAGGKPPAGLRTGRLYIAAGEAAPGSPGAGTPQLSPGYVLSSDPGLVQAGRATACDQDRLLRDRREGEFLVSWQSPGGWVAISKDVLTAVLGAGQDAGIAGLPPAALAVLETLCGGLAVRA